MLIVTWNALRCLVMLILLTGARVGETWRCAGRTCPRDGVLTFLHMKTGDSLRRENG
jgi:hypothetical protein